MLEIYREVLLHFFKIEDNTHISLLNLKLLEISLNLEKMSFTI